MNNKLWPSTAASVAARVFNIRKSNSYKREFEIDFIENFKVTNKQIKDVSGGLINQLLNLVTQITGSLRG